LMWWYSRGIDRLYWLELRQAACGLWLVKFAYGVRGEVLQQATKTPTPVSYAVAATIYKIYFDEKIAKGYQVVTDINLLKAVPSTGAAAEPARQDLSEQLAETLRRLSLPDNSRARDRLDPGKQPRTAPRKLKF